MSTPEAENKSYSSDTTQYDVQAIRNHLDAYKPVITVVSGQQVGKTLILESSTTVIGRDFAADMLLIDGGISRHHAEIEFQSGGAVVIRDLNSTNGVRLNGKLIADAPLESGDKIQLGPETVIEYRVEDPDEVAARIQQYERSIQDDLTGIYNRRYFTVTLEHELSYMRRRGAESSLVLLDIDHFKRVNDEYGHRSGDKVLKLITQTVTSYIREKDMFARWGGEEFVILLRGMSTNGAVAVAERIRARLANLRLKRGESILTVTASFGVTEIDLDRHDCVESAMHEVDGHLYSAKDQGRNRVVS